MIPAELSLDLSRISKDLACSPDSKLQIFLFEAIFKGQTDIVRVLLDHDINIVNSLDPTGATPLVCSVLQRNVTVCETLLRYKECNVNKRDEKGWTALHHAVNEGCEDVVSVLLKHGAKINYRTRLHKYTPLHIATYNNNLNIINYLKLFNPKVNAKDLSRRTVLHLAVENNVDISILRALLQMGCDPNLMNRQVLTPLMMAVKDGNVNILRELIEHGADINIPDSTGKTPLYVATDEKHSEIIQILFQRGSVKSLCPLDGPHRMHSTALHLAIYKEYDDNLISMLLQEKTELEAINSNDQTPLMFAVYIDKKSVVNTLINFGANRQTRDFRGRNPIFFVVKRGDFELCAALLGVLHQFKGNTDLLLSKAIEYNLPDYVQTCIQNGTRIMDHHMCSALDILEDNTILNILINYGKLELNGCVECLEKAVAIDNLKAARAILEGNADPNYKSPLAIAAAHNNIEMIQLLVDFKADTASHTISGFSALHWATENIHSEALQTLVKNAPDPESESQSSDESFLINVIGNRHSAILEYFIHAKSKSSIIEDNELSEAIENNQLSIVKRLVNEGYKINENHRILAERLKDEEIKKYFLTIDKNDLDISVISKRNRVCEEKCLEGYEPKMEIIMLAESRILLQYGPHAISHPLASITLHAATACGFIFVIKRLRKYIKAEDINNQARTTTKPSCLHLAAMHNRLKIVRLLIKSGADVNMCDINMETPIWMSVREKNLKIVNILLKAGATTTGLNNIGKSLVQEAVETGYTDMVRVLLQKGAQPLLDLTKRGKGLNNEIFSSDPQLKKQMLKVFIKHLKNTDVDGDDAALWAMKLGDPDILRNILKIDKNLINGQNNLTGLNLLHHAVDLDHQEFVRYFECLEEFEMNLDQFCFAEETPLYRAIQNRRFENAALLVKCKANCELGSRKPQHSSIALANFLKQEYLVEFMIAAGSAPPSGWNRKLGINLQSITIIAIRNLFPQAGFRKKIHFLQKKLPEMLIKQLLLE